MSAILARPARTRVAHLTVIATVVAGIALVWAPGAATGASSAVSVRNASFESGLKGWRQTGTRSIRTSVVRGGPSGKRALKMRAVRRSTIVLDDKRSLVTRAAKGQRYRVSVWVRGSRGSMKGQLRLRERGKGATVTHRQGFTLRGSSWRRVSLVATTKRSGAALDLNVAVIARGKQSLYVDGVSVARVSTASSAGRASVAVRPCGARQVSQRGITSCGTLFGAAVGANADPAGFEGQVGGRLGVRRTFWTARQVDSAVRTARSDVAHGRQPWVSFKLPYSWEQMAAGRGDAWAREIATKMRSVGGPVWVAFHHEPEGDGNIKAWTAMQRRLAPIVRATAPNVGYSIILTGWNQLYGKAEYRMNALWPHGTKVDIAGFDIYNWYGAPKGGRVEKRVENLDQRYFAPIGRWARSKGVAWGLAETAYTHAADRSDPRWLGNTYAAVSRNGGIAMAYFNTPLNNAGASWPLETTSKRTAFARVLRTAPRLR